MSDISHVRLNSHNRPLEFTSSVFTQELGLRTREASEWLNGKRLKLRDLKIFPLKKLLNTICCFIDSL